MRTLAALLCAALAAAAPVHADPAVPQPYSACPAELTGAATLPFGQALVACAGIGFASYGVYLFFRARYAKL